METGSRFGPYEILESLGTGGMGEVYRARDVELGRMVAVKVLREELANDAALIARLEREARLLASLEHPRIARLYTFAEADGQRFLTMELVEGESLAERLKRGPLPVADALFVCAQIAEGLDAAHLTGVIHRDLKPANVLLDTHGDARLADFGIARSMEPGSPQATALPTSGPDLTGQGERLGTAPYMSPEQARGGAVDARTDIWALGCTLYECLTGAGPFDRATPADTMAAILTEEVDWSRLPAGVPPRVRRLLERMLRKDPRERQRAAGDAWMELREAVETTSEPAVTLAEESVSRLRIVMAVLGLATLGALAGWALLRPPDTAPRLPRRFEIPLPPGTERGSLPLDQLAISPDGQSVVFRASDRLWLRRLDSLESTAIPGTERAMAPFFAPDGEQLGFWHSEPIDDYVDDGYLKRISLRTGGAPVPIVEAPTGPARAAWSEDGYLYFAPYWGGHGIVRVPEIGGEIEVVVPPEEGVFVGEPSLLPGDERLLYARTMAAAGPGRDAPLWAEGEIVLRSLRDGAERVVVERGASPRYASPGYLLYARDRSLFAVRFDPVSGAVIGGAVTALDSVLQPLLTAPTYYDFSRTGTLVYLRGGRSSLGDQLVWIDRQGNEEPLAFEPAAAMGMRVRLSPDGTRAVAGHGDLWVHDFVRNSRARLPTERFEHQAVWSPDGEWLYYGSIADPEGAGDQDIWRQRVDRSLPPEPVLEMERHQIPADIPSTGEYLLFDSSAPDSVGYDIWMLPLTPDMDAPPVPLAASVNSESSPRASPDGRFFAFQSTSSPEVSEIFVQEIATGRRYPVSTSALGGADPTWSNDGRRIYYWSHRRLPVTPECPYCDRPQLLEVDLQFEPSFSASLPRLVTPAHRAPFTDYSITPDGERFLVIQSVPNPDAATPHDPLIVVLDWFEELKAKFASGG